MTTSSMPVDEQLQTAVDSILRDAVSTGTFLGLSFITVGRHGQVLYSGAYGHEDFAITKPMTIRTSGFIASMTKLMTSIAAMQVVERGLVGLDDDLGAMIAELGDQTILTSFNIETRTATWKKPSEKITLRNLLTHSSGFAYDAHDRHLLAWATAQGKEMEIFSGEWKASERPLVFNPGSSWRYGPGIDWAGKVVETVSNMSLEDYMQDNIWSRLGMLNTTFHPEHRQSFPTLDLGMRLNGPSEALTLGQNPWPIPARDEMGGAGVYSSVQDYAFMLSALLSDDSPLLKLESIEELLRPQLSESSKSGLADMRRLNLVQIDIPQDIRVDHSLSGLVVMDEIPDRRKKGTVCWDGATNSHWMLDQSTGIGCVLLVQVLPHGDLATMQLWTELEMQIHKHVNKIGTH